MGFDYTEENGVYCIRDLRMAPHPPERILAHLYYQFEAQGLLEILFHEGEKPTLRWFLSTFLAPETSTLACYRETPDGEYPVGGKRFSPLGITWINKSWRIGENFKKAECGMGFVRHIPVNDTVDCARMTIEWAFQNLALDSLIGTTPAPNRAATIFGSRVGFNQCGPVYGYTAWQGKLCAVMIQSLTRDQWLKARLTWSEVAA